MKFPFTLHGSNISTFSGDDSGRIYLDRNGAFASVNNDVTSEFQCETEISDREEFLAVRKLCPTNIDDKSDTIKVMYVIHSNGKIYFYYENIPRGLNKKVFESGFGYYITCEKDYKGPTIYVPDEWIESGTLVEYEVLGDCPNHNSFEACRGGATPNPKCIWCEIANTCITTNDEDDHDFKENGCRNKSSIVEVSSEPTTIATTETDLINGLKETSGSTESHLNMTTDTTIEVEKRKSPQYVFLFVFTYATLHDLSVSKLHSD
ncbi:unnamed protein product [Schistosoma haematobium]|nr:unnamed protein product [Schistosoma haematobium]